jgi:hypothetical protein
MSNAEPSVVELEAAITLHAKQAARHPRWWDQYEWTHEQINLLLDQRERQLAQDKMRIAARVRELFGPRG